MHVFFQKFFQQAKKLFSELTLFINTTIINIKNIVNTVKEKSFAHKAKIGKNELFCWYCKKL
jgi:hypothetical protein